jgi:predicted protein tyrosine phosphatase
MITKVKALPYVYMEQLKRSSSALLKAHRFISVIEPQGGVRIFSEDSDENRVLTLFFDEVSPCMWPTSSEYEQVVKQFHDRGSKFVIFDEKIADCVIDFVARAQTTSEPETLFVNCSLGVARSGAIVRFVADILSLDATKFARLNPHIEPNQHVLHLLHKRWCQRGLANASATVEPGAHCSCGHAYQPEQQLTGDSISTDDIF